MRERRLLVLAGPNGSGKTSTFINMFREDTLPGPYISPDVVVEEEPFRGISDEEERYISTMQYCEKVRHSYIESGQSFCFETVLSGTDKVDFVNYAKSKGFFIEMLFISTNNPEVNIRRVKERVSQGGHSVPTDKIVSRYYKSRDNLSRLIETCDSLVILDNSIDNQNKILGFIKEDGVNYLVNREVRPTWIDNAVTKYYTGPVVDLSIEDTNREFYTREVGLLKRMDLI